MLNVAYIFPGQGAQYVGMGEDLFQRYPQAKEVFQAADRILDFELSKLCFQGPEEELTKTINCQVAVFTTSYAFLRALQAGKPQISVKFTAGLSLGEYTALVAAEALDFSAGLNLVRNRALYMEQASQANPGGMVCIIGLNLAQVEQICQETKAEVANLNCPGQIVISANLQALEKAKQLALAKGAKKVIPLKVSGAFHSSLMASGSHKLAQDLEEIVLEVPKMPLVSNVTAKGEESPAEIKANLVRQLVARTRWQDSINFISSCGIREFIEIGPGKVLNGLVRKIDPKLKVDNIGTVEELEEFKEEHKL